MGKNRSKVSVSQPKREVNDFFPPLKHSELYLVASKENEARVSSLDTPHEKEIALLHQGSAGKILATERAEFSCLNEGPLDSLF